MSNIKKHNKLIRDRIPEVLERKGVKYKTHVAGSDEYKEKLIEKLKEEVDEFSEDRNEEELADVLEVVEAIIGGLGFSRQNVERLKEKKLIERGGFNDRLILEEASE